MTEKSVGMWGSSSDGTYWCYKPSGPLTRMEFSTGQHKTIYSINFIGAENYIAGRDQFYYPDGFDIKSPSEYLVGIKGGYKVFPDPRGSFTAIQWLSFETNVGTVYGPYGPVDAGYTEFSYKSPNGGSIIGFEGRAEEHLYAIGVVVKLPPPPPPPTTPPPPSQPVVELGPWGNVSTGERWTYNPDRPITEIVVVELGFIVSLTFKTDKDIQGTSFGGGPGCSCNPTAITHTIKLNFPSVYLNGISGTCESNSDILSLRFQTNDGTRHGPFGSVDRGTPFSTTNVKDGYAITGFYGQNGIHINAIGVYTKPLPLPPPPPFIQPLITLGLWGNSAGGVGWIHNPDKPIVQIVVVHVVGGPIVSTTFKTDIDVQGPSAGTNVGTAPNPNQTKTQSINLNNPSVFVIGISGSYGNNGNIGSTVDITSVSFHTNDGTRHGPFGDEKGTPFSTTNSDNGYTISGFSGHSGCEVKAKNDDITKPKPTESNWNPYIFVNHWGGKGGCDWKFLPKGNITQIVIVHGEAIRSLTFKCDNGEVSQKFGGGADKRTNVIDIKPGVRLTGISGTVEISETYKVVTSLRFYTNENAEFGPFGTEYGTTFSLLQDGSIIGFHGRSGGLIDAIGVYLQPPARC